MKPEKPRQTLLRADVAEFYRRWPDRKRKLLRPGQFSVGQQSDSGRWLLRKGFSLERAELVIAAHQQIRDQSPAQLLKNNRRRRVSKVEVDGGNFIVKEFRRPGPWGRFAADARSWVFNWGLEFCGLHVAKCFAWLRAKNGVACLVFEYLDGPTFYEILKDRAEDAAAFGQLSEKLYALLRELYRWRIVHEDLRMANLIVCGPEPEICLVDNDAVLFNRKIGARQWRRNRRHLLGESNEPCMLALKSWLDSQPPPYMNL